MRDMLILLCFFGAVVVFLALGAISVTMTVVSFFTGVFYFWPTLAVTAGSVLCGFAVLRMLR